MEPTLICQSCTMPIDNLADRGTEKDHSKSSEYCKYCYQDGTFVQPNMSLEQMKEIVVQQMERRHIPEAIIRKSMEALPHLRRWQKLPV
jgi:hypothetical protein